jgi:acyl carrier protein
VSERERVYALVAAAITELNQQLPPGARAGTEPESALFGADGPLDSLGLVNLIVGVEEKISQAYGHAPNLADEALLNTAESPFGCVAALVDYVVGTLAGAP